jgi:hypothetical protein
MRQRRTACARRDSTGDRLDMNRRCADLEAARETAFRAIWNNEIDAVFADVISTS